MDAASSPAAPHWADRLDGADVPVLPDVTDQVLRLASDPNAGLTQVAQALIAELTAADAFGQPIVTEVLALANYCGAEAYHQDFFERNPYQGYCMAVAAPKVSKFKKTFARLVRE